MNSERTAGGVLLVVSLFGYVVGVAAPYPGRSASLVGIMVGVTLVAIGMSEESA